MKVITPSTNSPRQTPGIRANGLGYVVHANGRVIKCHNLATARFYLRQAKLTKL